MRKIICLLFFHIAFNGCGQDINSDHELNSEQDFNILEPMKKIAFSQVNVITMKVQEEVLQNMTVLVENGIIVGLQEASVSIPEDYHIVEAPERYVLPALADMHTHAIEANDMFLYLANGVTKVRHMWGSDRLLELKRSIDQRKVPGPKIYAASPGFEEPPSYWPGPVLLNDIKEVDNLVEQQKEKGYDFIKAYSNISAPMYERLLQSANDHEIRVVGHVSHQVGIEMALQSGHSSIAHIDGYLEYCLTDDSDINNPNSYQLNASKLSHIAQRTAEAEVWNCPTLTITTRNLSQKSDLESNSELKYVSPRMRTWFDSPGTGLNAWPSEVYMIHKNVVVNSLREKGVKFILGVDTGLRYLLPGFTVHEELENFVKAGFSSYEALETATVNVATFLRNSDEYGTIEVGKKADFILLNDNPLDDIKNTKKLAGVMMEEYWLTKQVLDLRLDEIAASYK